MNAMFLSIIFDQYRVTRVTQHQIILTFQFIFGPSGLEKGKIANNVFQWNFLA